VGSDIAALPDPSSWENRAVATLGHKSSFVKTIPRTKAHEGRDRVGKILKSPKRLKSRDGTTDTTGMSLNIPQADLLSRLLDVASLRHRVISHNLANVNTPGYQKLEVAFEDTFARALSKQGNSGALRVTPRIVEGHDTAVRQDGNTVDLDREVGNLNKNSIMFGTAMQMLISRINMMRSAITGR
jgi:flagellar basal-body rod protein FlgB